MGGGRRADTEEGAGAEHPREEEGGPGPLGGGEGEEGGRRPSSASASSVFPSSSPLSFGSSLL